MIPRNDYRSRRETALCKYAPGYAAFGNFEHAEIIARFCAATELSRTYPNTGDWV